MNVDARRAVAVVPSAVVCALLAHQIRFGEDHAMGGEGHGALVGFAVASLLIVAAGALWMLARTARLGADGSVLARRLQAALPGDGRVVPNASAITTGAALAYFGIEALEGSLPTDSLMLDVCLPAVVLALLGVLAALLTRALARALAELTIAWVAGGAVLRQPDLAAVDVASPRLRRLPGGRVGFGALRGRAPPTR